MPELKLHHPARSTNLLAPVLVAFVVLGIVIALVIRYTPHRTADISVLNTSVYPVHIAFKSNSIVVGAGQSEDDLYVVLNLRIEDRLNLPIFLKDFTATLVTDQGETLHSSAVEKPDLENLFTTFPALRGLASEPLLRETVLTPAQTVQGSLIFRFAGTQQTWDRRRAASVTVDSYHQGPLTVPIPFADGRKSAANAFPATDQNEAF